MGLPLSLGASQLSVSPTIVIVGVSGTPAGVRRVEVREVERGGGIGWEKMREKGKELRLRGEGEETMKKSKVCTYVHCKPKTLNDKITDLGTNISKSYMTVCIHV